MKSHIIFINITILLASCQNYPNKVGHERDAHGCLGSAGYLWCKKTNQCERPWEIAKSKGLEHQPQAFDDYCNTP